MLRILLSLEPGGVDRAEGKNVAEMTRWFDRGQLLNYSRANNLLNRKRVPYLFRRLAERRDCI
jgi:hypothetical protein